MLKTEAIRMLGGTPSEAARRIGIKPQAVSGWPDELTPAIADRVQAAIARELLQPEQLGIDPSIDDERRQGNERRAA